MKPHFKRLLFVSMLCLFFTAISNANLGIISQFASQNNNDWVGPLSIALVFLGSGIGALYSRYIHKYPFNRIIFTGSLGWNIFIAFSVMFLFIGFEDYIIAVIAIGSLVCGLTMSLYYNGTFNYVNECGWRDRATEMYFAINMCFNQSSNIVGNLLSSLLIEPLGQKTYSFVMLGLQIAVSLCFLFLKQFQYKGNQSQITANGKQSILIQQNDNRQISNANSLPQTSSIKNKPPFNIIFCFAMSGIIISFIYGQFSILFYKYYQDMGKEELNRLTFTTFMIEGCGQFSGGLLLALISSKIKNISLVFTAVSLMSLASIGLISYGFSNDDKNVIFGGSFFLGMADCLCFAMSLSIAGQWSQLGISLFNLGQSGTVAILSILHIFLDLPYLSIIYGAVFCLSTVSIWINKNNLSSSSQQLKDERL